MKFLCKVLQVIFLKYAVLPVPFSSLTISALTWLRWTPASTLLHCTSSAKDSRDVSRWVLPPFRQDFYKWRTLQVSVEWAVCVCACVGHRNGVMSVKTAARLHTSGGNKWKWPGKTLPGKKKTSLGNLQDSLWIKLTCYEEENVTCRHFF